MKREIRLPLTLLITVFVVVIGAGLSSYAKRAPKTKNSQGTTTHSFSSLGNTAKQSKSVEAARAAFEKARESEARNPTKEATLATMAALAAYKEAIDARIAEIGESLSTLNRLAADGSLTEAALSQRDDLQQEAAALAKALATEGNVSQAEAASASEPNSSDFAINAQTQTCNSSQIIFNESLTPPTAGAPYPSTINVAGLNTITKVTVTINDFRHFFPDDADLLLVGPTGAQLIIWSDVGGATPVGCTNSSCTTSSTGVTITLDDAAASLLPDNTALTSGTFRPSDAGAATDTFPAPAPVGPYNRPAPNGVATFASVFNGTNPNGAWSLYVVDDLSGDAGRIVSGWCLNLTTADATPTPTATPTATPTPTPTATPTPTPCAPGVPSLFTNNTQVNINDGIGSPYPSNITVSGLGPIQKVTVTLNDFRHFFPDDVDMLLVSPSGAKFVIWSDVGGTVPIGCTNTGCTTSNPGATITLDDAAASALPDAAPLVSGTFRPTDVGAGDTFAAPAPVGPYNVPAPNGAATFASTFNGSDPNGTWSLYVVDDASGDVGKLVGGWTLSITSNCVTPTPTPTPSPSISPGAGTIVQESCPPTNGAIDPGETDTVSLTLVNTGAASTTNLVATLQASANVLSPSGPQVYGAIAPAGSASRNFTFTANGNCGDTITLTLHLQDGATNLGTASFNFTLGCNTSCAGVPRISTSTVLSCSGADTVATITISNTGTGIANNVVLTTAKIAAVNGTPLPQVVGVLAPGASSVKVVTFSGVPSGIQTVQVGGTHTGGSFNTSRKMSVPACGIAGVAPAFRYEVPALLASVVARLIR